MQYSFYFDIRLVGTYIRIQFAIRFLGKPALDCKHKTMNSGLSKHGVSRVRVFGSSLRITVWIRARASGALGYELEGWFMVSSCWVFVNILCNLWSHFIG